MASTLTPTRPQSLAAPRDSFSVLRKEMDDLLSSFFGYSTSNWLPVASGPAMDIVESDKTFTVKLDAPGMEAKDFQIQMHGNTLTVSGNRQEEKVTDQKMFHRMERRYGSFSRTITLPCKVNDDEVAAEYANGVLTLTLPKCEEARAKKISVKG
ncbi:MAG: Hsp20/alpha crystallin family protein [Pirellula sp.]